LVRDAFVTPIGGGEVVSPAAEYDDFVRWERQGGHERSARYWDDVVRDLEVTVPPSDPAAADEPAGSVEHWLEVPANLLEAVRERAPACGATPACSDL